MAAPFITLGLKGANFLIDKHFEKIPDKYMHRKAYKPEFISKKKRHGKSRSSESDTSSSESDDEIPRTRYRNMQGSGAGSTGGQGGGGIPSYSHDAPYFTTPVYSPYSQEPPMSRPQYTPSPPPIGQTYQYGVPPSGGQSYAYGSGAPSQVADTQYDDRRRSYYDDDYRSDDNRSSRSSRRGMALARRSSSYHGTRGGDDGRSQLSTRRRSSDNLNGDRDLIQQHGIKDMFSTSKKGLAGAAVGALVGGWAADKAQAAYGKHGHGKKDANPLLTLLGAVAAGAAVNIAVDKWEEGQSAGDKYASNRDNDRDNDRDIRDDDEDSDDGRSRRSGRSEKSHHHHHRRHDSDDDY